MRITATPQALDTVRLVRTAGRENLVMVLGTGCCDSTAPFLYDDYLPEPDSEQVGEIDGIQILAPRWLADLYPGDAALVVDADLDVLNDSFSLESEHDRRFTLRVPKPDADGKATTA